MAVRTEYVSITDAALLINVHRQTIWRWCDEGLFRTAQLVGKTWMITKKEIVAYGEYYHSTEFEEVE